MRTQIPDSCALLDLANSYGSVHHSLIDFPLHHYHTPHFCNVVASLYSGLPARVSTDAWTSPSFPRNIGVYQGDPLSGIIFNAVINTLVDTLNLKKDLGYSLSPSHQVNLLQYADDTCIIASSPAAAESLLDSTSVSEPQEDQSQTNTNVGNQERLDRDRSCENSVVHTMWVTERCWIKTIRELT